MVRFAEIPYNGKWNIAVFSSSFYVRKNFFEGKTVFEKYYRGDCYEEVLEKKCSIINGVQPVDGK